MSQFIELHGIKLIPVLDLEPALFAKNTPSPSGTTSSEWKHYWQQSLADSGITEISPIVPASRHVSTRAFSRSQLERYFQVICDDFGGLSSLNDQEPDLQPVLNGGLALISEEYGLLVQPTCCSSLSNLDSWREAVTYESADWKMLWIGHPWISMKFQKPWLILSDLDESSSPPERWAVRPNELGEAVAEARIELRRLSKDLAEILTVWNYDGDPARLALILVGLESELSH